MSAIQAVYQNGVFKPKQPVELPEGCEVTVSPAPPPAEESALEREIRWLTSRTPEEIMAAREELRKASRPPRPLPPGKTLSDMVEGKWPGGLLCPHINVENCGGACCILRGRGISISSSIVSLCLSLRGPRMFLCS